MLQPAACFVTLEVKGQLQGCIGSTIATKPLILEMHNKAIGSAYEDRRFMPLAEDQLDDLSIEVEVLSPLVIQPFTTEAELAEYLSHNKQGVLLTDRSKVKYQAIDGRIKYGSYVDWHDANPQLDQDIKAKGHGRKFIQTFYSEFNAINVFYHSLQFYSRKEWKEKAPNHYAYASSNGLAALINRRRIYFQRFVGFIRPTILKASNQLPFCVTSATYLTRSAAATYGVWDLYPKRHQKKKFTYKRESRWSVERLKEVASNYDSASDFLHFELSAYHAASKQGLLRELTKEMNTKVHRPYNEDSVRELLKRYSN